MKDLRNRSQREREAIAEAILEAYREEEADISIYISQAGAELRQSAPTAAAGDGLRTVFRTSQHS
jgi:hypothetical protein